MAQADPGEVPEVEDVEQNVDVVEKIYGIFQVTQRRSLRTYLNSYQRLNSPEALTLRTTLLNDNPQPEIVTDDIVEVQGPEPKIIADYIVKVQEQVEKLIQAHQNAVDQNRGPPKTLRELRDNCLFFKQLTGHLRYEQALRNTNDPAFISKQNFRSLHSIESEDLVDACHIIANNNGGPCHMYNLNPGGSGKNRSDRDKRDADNIYALSGTSNSPGQPAVNAVWICLWCDKVKKHHDLDDAFNLTTVEHVFELIPGNNMYEKRQVDIPKELESTRLLSKKMFLDSELMRPFVDELCEQHRAKSRTSIINDILSKVKEKPTQLGDVDVKAPDTIIATWLHKVGGAKNVEIDTIDKAKKDLKKSIKESTEDSCRKLELDEPSEAEQIVTRLGDRLSEVFKDVLKEYRVTPN